MYTERKGALNGHMDKTHRHDARQECHVSARACAGTRGENHGTRILVQDIPLTHSDVSDAQQQGNPSKPHG